MALIKVVNNPLLKGTIPCIFYLLIELLPPPIYLMCHGTKRRAESISKFHRRKEIGLINLLITVEFHLENLSAKKVALNITFLTKRKAPHLSAKTYFEIQLQDRGFAKRQVQTGFGTWYFLCLATRLNEILTSGLITLSQSKKMLIFQNKVKPDYYVFNIQNMLYWITVLPENKLLLLRYMVLCSSPAHTHWNKLQRNLQR